MTVMKTLKEIRTFREIRAEVDKRSGIHAIQMDELRLAMGDKRPMKLGRNVCEKISQSLKSLGLEHFPAELPASGPKTVLLFSHSFFGWDVITALLNPSEEGVDVIRERLRRK
jgi:hypothetical protein